MKNKYVFVTVMLAVLLFLGVGLTEIYVNHTEEKEDGQYTVVTSFYLSLIHISEPTRH